jgi:predicted O-methyltransferase YrrM
VSDDFTEAPYMTRSFTMAPEVQARRATRRSRLFKIENLRRGGKLTDLVLSLFVWPAAYLLRLVRQIGLQHLPRCRKVLLRIGVFPIRNHYYEPQFDFRGQSRRVPRERNLPALDLNVDGQLRQLEALHFQEELAGIVSGPARRRFDNLDFRFGNVTFESGDAEYWYQLIRATKPRRIFEIGSGNSTLMALRALSRNREEDPAYQCEHVCVEPYEMPWLERAGVSVLRQRVEDVDLALFRKLDAGDILFIDSSHVIRPYGDVLFEYLELLPSLRPGVIVHAHDIFTPRNYPRQWVEDRVRLWNEQYLLEAFLSHNDEWEVIGALNYLSHHHFDRLKRVAPYLTPDREPASFYLRRVA